MRIISRWKSKEEGGWCRVCGWVDDGWEAGWQDAKEVRMSMLFICRAGWNVRV